MALSVKPRVEANLREWQYGFWARTWVSFLLALASRSSTALACVLG